MTEPSKAAVEKACELLGIPVEFYPDYGRPHASRVNVARFIDHVSEVATNARAAIISYSRDYDEMIAATLTPLILPDPEPDVLAEILADQYGCGGPHEAAAVREELAKRGGRIVFDQVQP